MCCYEPGSGWNLPPGCYDGDPRTPWNQEDEPTCADCSHMLESSCDYGVCELELADAFDKEKPAAPWAAALWALGWAAEHYKNTQEDVCGRCDA